MKWCKYYGKLLGGLSRKIFFLSRCDKGGGRQHTGRLRCPYPPEKIVLLGPEPHHNYWLAIEVGHGVVRYLWDKNNFHLCWGQCYIDKLMNFQYMPSFHTHICLYFTISFLALPSSARGGGSFPSATCPPPQ